MEPGVLGSREHFGPEECELASTHKGKTHGTTRRRKAQPP
jgi:hypothetical protein